MFQVKYKDGGIDMGSEHIFSEVFNFQIYDMNGELLFQTDTVRANAIEHKQTGNKLIIEDVLVYTKMFHDVMYGKYDGKRVKVIGQTIVTTLDRDEAVLEMEVGVAEIAGYMIDGVSGKHAYGSKMVITFSDVNSEGERNFNLNLLVQENPYDFFNKDREKYKFFE